MSNPMDMDAILAGIWESILRDDVYRGTGSGNTSRGGASLHKMMQVLRLQQNSTGLHSPLAPFEDKFKYKAMDWKLGYFMVDEIRALK